MTLRQTTRNRARPGQAELGAWVRLKSMASEAIDRSPRGFPKDWSGSQH